jgi:predicted Zn-dependent protease
MKYFVKFLFIFLSLSFSVNSGHFDDYILMDDESESFLKEIIDKLKDSMKYPGNINIYISSSQILNASANQNGNIIINAGAILQCKDVKELIAILAHETGHIAGSHIETFLSTRDEFMKAGLVTALIGAFASILANDTGPLIAGVAGSQSIASGMALSKLRQKENIADTKAAQAIQSLNWPIFEGFVSIHQKLLSAAGIYDTYLSTHPQSQDRISKFKEYYENEKKQTFSVETTALIQKFQKNFETVQHKIKALILSPESIVKLYSHPKNVNEKYAKAIALYRQHKYTEAINIIDELIIPSDEETDLAYYTEIKAMCLINLKKCQEAADICWNILKNEKKMKIHRDLGIIYADAIIEGNLTRHTQNAIKVLKKVLITHENDISVLNMKGKLYSIIGKNEEASLYAAEVAILIGDNKTAIIHAKKASNSTNKIVKQKEIDIINLKSN